MSSYSPLQIAGKVVYEVLNAKVDFSEDGNYFSYYFFEDSGLNPRMELICIDRKSHLLLEFALAIYYDLSPLSDLKKISALLDKSVAPFLDGLYDGGGAVFLEKDADGSIIPTYTSSIDYAPLENSDLRDQIRQNLIRGVRALKLLSPILNCLEHQYLPTIEERMKMLYREHCKWEFDRISTDVPKHAVRLPPGLFGGVRSFTAQ